MAQKNSIFFGNVGLTSTSANHVANLAKEYVQGLKAEINNVRFYQTDVALIGTSQNNLISAGSTESDLAAIPQKLAKIAAANSLIAWLREAIKARVAEQEELDRMSVESWAELNAIELPQHPQRERELTRDDVIATLSIKERNRILTLEAKAAVLGKYIHPDGAFSTERAELRQKIRDRHDVRGDGRDTLLYTYTPTVDEQAVEDMFFNLQKEYRALQAELNGINHNIEEQLREHKAKATRKLMEECNRYDAQMEQLRLQFEAFVESESKAISALKIVVPNDLKEIYDEVNTLGK